MQSDILTSLLLCYHLISEAYALPVSGEKILSNMYIAELSGWLFQHRRMECSGWTILLLQTHRDSDEIMTWNRCNPENTKGKIKEWNINRKTN